MRNSEEQIPSCFIGRLSRARECVPRSERNDRRQSTRCPRPARSAARFVGDGCIHPQNRGSGGQRVGSLARRWIVRTRLNAARSSRRRDTAWQARDESPLRARRDRESAATSSRSHRRHVACKRCAPRSRAPSSLRTASNVPAASGLSCPSPLSRSLRSSTLGVLPRDCVHPLRACTKRCPAGAQRVRCDCTPCTPAAALSGCRPRPRIARHVSALFNRCRVRSRGFGPSVDITRDYAQASCLCGAARGVLPRSQRRARVIRRYVNGRPARPCARQGAPLLRRVVARPARAARHPWLARFVQLSRVARGLLCAAPGRLSPRARKPTAIGRKKREANSQGARRGGCRRFARCCRFSVAPCSPRQCQALRVATRALTRLRAAL